MDVTWTWIERDPKWDVGYIISIGLFDGLIGYKDGDTDTFGAERAGFGLSTHMPSIQPPFYAFGWMDGSTIGVSSPVVILCVVAGISGIRAYRRRRYSKR